MTNEGKRARIALAGIPNVGKSLIFNRLTGGRAWVGNWPGVTVEKKVGTLRVNGVEVEVIDLPGIYSLTAYSVDELIARNFIVEEKPDVVVCIVSAINLERGLYLALSLLELGANVIIDLNMVDLAEKEGYRINHKKLEAIIGVPVIPTIAPTGYGIDKLKEAIGKAIHEKKPQIRIVNYGNIVEKAIILLSGDVLTPDHFDLHPKSSLNILGLEHNLTLEDVERMMIVGAMKRANNNQTLAAKQLGISYSTLYRKLKKFNIRS